MFAIYILLIFSCIFDIYNIIFDYYGFLERIINYSKLYFIGVQVLIIMNLIEFILRLVEKIKEKNER